MSLLIFRSKTKLFKFGIHSSLPLYSVFYYLGQCDGQGRKPVMEWFKNKFEKGKNLLVRVDTIAYQLYA